jgi:hypothetical protein
MDRVKVQYNAPGIVVPGQGPATRKTPGFAVRPFPDLFPGRITRPADRNDCPGAERENSTMAKTNYAFEKRQRDLLKKQKKEEKQKRKAETSGKQPELPEGEPPETDPGQGVG